MVNLLKDITGPINAIDDSIELRLEQIKDMVTVWRLTHNLLYSYDMDRDFPPHLKNVVSYLLHDGNEKVRACNHWLSMSPGEVNKYRAALDIIQLYTFYSMAEVVIELLKCKYFKE